MMKLNIFNITADKNSILINYKYKEMERMIIKKIIQKPFSRYTVKKNSKRRRV